MVERDQSFDDQGMMRTHRLSLFMSEQQHNTPRARPCHVSCSACDGPVGVSHLLLDSEASVHPVSGMLSSGAVELVETLGWFGLCQRLERTFRFERNPNKQEPNPPQQGLLRFRSHNKDVSDYSLKS